MGNFTNSRDPDEMPHNAAFHLSKKLRVKRSEIDTITQDTSLESDKLTNRHH